MSEANLGLATTRELLQELKVRAEVTMPEKYFGARAYITGSTKALLENLPAEILDYRTVGE